MSNSAFDIGRRPITSGPDAFPCDLPGDRHASSKRAGGARDGDHSFSAPTDRHRGCPRARRPTPSPRRSSCTTTNVGIAAYDPHSDDNGPNWTAPALIAPGTLTFAQAPTDADTFDPVVITQASSAALGITGIRHNMPIGGVVSRCAAQWTAMRTAGLKLYLCLFDGGAGGTYPGDDPNTATAATERTTWANGVVTVMLHLQSVYPGLLAAAEVWNEPDGSWPIPADKFVLLVEAVHSAMRAQPALANIPLVAPATVAGERAPTGRPGGLVG